MQPAYDDSPRPSCPLCHETFRSDPEYTSVETSEFGAYALCGDCAFLVEMEPAPVH